MGAASPGSRREVPREGSRTWWGGLSWGGSRGYRQRRRVGRGDAGVPGASGQRKRNLKTMDVETGEFPGGQKS